MFIVEKYYNTYMNNYAYATYIDKKIFLPGLQGLYYSLISTKTKYNLIILYCGEITEKDIWKYIDKKQVILYKIKDLHISRNRRMSLQEFNDCNDNTTIYEFLYYSNQFANALNPLYFFNFKNYKAIIYLHCDVLITKQIDNIFNYIINKKKNIIAYCYKFYDKSADGTKMFLDTSLCIFFPTDAVWQYIKNNLHIFNKMRILNMDIVFTILNKHFKIEEIGYPINGVHHFGGPLKWWTMFPNFNIKKLIANNKLWDKAKTPIMDFIRNKIEITKEKSKEEQYKYAINKNNIDIFYNQSSWFC